MKTILREDESGVSEVLGTILILTMTVVLFSVVVLWVSAIPTPVAQTRVDIAGTMDTLPAGSGVNITLTHGGGEALAPVPTILYVTDVTPAGVTTTDVLTLHLFSPRLANPNGLLDGKDSEWDIGERWAYQNAKFSTADQITVTIVDTSRGMVVWTSPINPIAGSRPPIFVSVWTDGFPNTPQIDPVQAGLGFALYAHVEDPDGDLNPNSVFATFTVWFGVDPTCSMPIRMNDRGQAGDAVAGDHIFTIGESNIPGGTGCISQPYPQMSWDNSAILLNATDMKGHQTQTRFTLHVVLPFGSSSTFSNQTIPSALWQYIGYVQIRTGEVWVSNMSDPQGYNSPSRYQPFRVTATMLNGNGGALFHFKMANHGNTTIFVDGLTEAFFQNTQSASGFVTYIIAPCSPTLTPSAGGVMAYPGSLTNINDFEYARNGLPLGCAGVAPSVFDINIPNQEQGGTPYTVMVFSKGPFTIGSGNTWKGSTGQGPITYFLSVLVSGMAGPANYTYGMLTSPNGPNPLNCPGLGPTYNPHDHLLDTIKACRSSWYAQVIPFIGMVVY